jgi:large subunit ribosomal protein L21
MYAVLKTGGKQYKVAPNDIIMVEKLAADAGTSIEIDEVLMIGDNQNINSRSSANRGCPSGCRGFRAKAR